MRGSSSILAAIIAAPTLASSAPVIVEGTSAPDVIDVSSSTAPHEIYGRSGDDWIKGSMAADVIDGGYGYDRLGAGPGNDSLIGGPGNDALDGGIGEDTALYSKSRASYEISGSAALFEVRALAWGDGIDSLSAVELLEFTDGRFRVAELLGLPVNRAPVARDDSAETTIDLDVAIEVLANDTDADGDHLRVGTIFQPDHGTAARKDDDTITYTPAAGFVGTDSFNYVVVDGHGGSDAGLVSIVVRPPASGNALMRAIATAPPGSWLKVNANRYEDVWTPAQQRARVNGIPFGNPRKIITAWGSMAWDGNRRQLIIWGGGHANYAGNEVYRFDAATLRWERASLPSAVRPPFNDRRYFAVDGAMNAPISSHTYDNQEFLPRADRFITFGGASYNAGRVFVLDDGVTRTGPYLWDPSRADANKVGGTTGSAILPGVLGGRMWENRNALVVNGSGASRPEAFVNGTSAYVFEGGVESILVSETATNGGDLFRYRITELEDPTLDRWELIGPGWRSYSDQGAGAYDPIHRLYLRTAKMGAGYGVVMWNVATPGPTNLPIKFTPPTAGGQFVLSRLHGMDFDPRRGVFVLWNGDGRVWYLKPPASGPAFSATGWTVTPAPVSGASVPALTGGTGVLGKWKYLASHDVMLGLGDGYEGQVWVYKPVGWKPPP